jgi:hypothetical protein
MLALQYQNTIGSYNPAPNSYSNPTPNFYSNPNPNTTPTSTPNSYSNPILNFNTNPAPTPNPELQMLALKYQNTIGLSNDLDLVSYRPDLGSSSGVIGALRYLQAKANNTEQELLNVRKERADLHRTLISRKSSKEFWQSRTDITMSGSFLTMEASMIGLEGVKRDMDRQCEALQVSLISCEHEISRDRAVLFSLETQKADADSIVHTLECNNRVLKGDLSSLSNRFARINVHMDSTPLVRESLCNQIYTGISAVEEEIEALLQSKKSCQVR